MIPGNTYRGIAVIILFPSGVGLMPKGDDCALNRLHRLQNKDLNKCAESSKHELKSISKIMLS
jgi:hypothetical protein